jgi:hypothetical protein
MPDFTYRPLAFTSPQTKTRLEFIYDGQLEDGVSHGLGEFQFSGVDEKYFQDRSQSSDSYGFTIFLDSQDDLRILRSVLNEKISQDNPGTLEHPDPTLGTFPVATSSYKVTQNSQKKIGMIAVSIVFFRTIPNLIGGDPSSSNNPASAAATLQAIDELNFDQALEFADSIDDSTGQGFAAIVETAIKAAEDAQTFLGDIAAQVDEINILFTTAVAEILSTADELARAPFDLARQIQNLIQLPMLAIDSATDRIAAYGEYVTETLTFGETQDNEFAAGSPAGKSNLSVAGMASLAAISAINYSAVSTKSVTLDEIKSGQALTEAGYLSRPQIIETIQSVINSAKNATEILSEKSSEFGAVTFFKQYFDFSILNKNIVTATVRNLNQRIFNTTSEVIVITESEMSPIRHCARLYGSIELNTVQFFNDSNKIIGDEIYLVKKGREIVFYE